MLTIALASSSLIKTQAVAQSLVDKHHWKVYPLEGISSGVAEQPMNLEEIKEGASNRLSAAIKLKPRAGLYISVESGLIREPSAKDSEVYEWVDRALVIVKTKGREISALTEGVLFPEDAVLKTMLKPGGLRLNTVGKVMLEMGLIKDHTDPHLELSGKSRAEYISETLSKLIDQLVLSGDVSFEEEEGSKYVNYGKSIIEQASYAIKGARAWLKEQL